MKISDIYLLVVQDVDVMDRIDEEHPDWYTGCSIDFDYVFYIVEKEKARRLLEDKEVFFYEVNEEDYPTFEDLKLAVETNTIDFTKLKPV